jgi:hypothetical protein
VARQHVVGAMHRACGPENQSKDRATHDQRHAMSQKPRASQHRQKETKPRPCMPSGGNKSQAGGNKTCA